MRAPYGAVSTHTLAGMMKAVSRKARPCDGAQGVSSYHDSWYDVLTLINIVRPTLESCLDRVVCAGPFVPDVHAAAPSLA